jgi:hypothetical protein
LFESTALRLYEWYSRESIASSLGAKYSRYWDQGVVRVGSDYLLFVTLDKSGRPAAERYDDRFLSPSEFQWQSQNQDSRAGRGAKYQNRGAVDLHFHLFLRRTSRAEDGSTSPFLYAGVVRFDSWQGDNPITIRWRLDHPIPDGPVRELAVRIE